MSTHFARLNIQLPDVPDFEAKVTKWESILNDAATCGYAIEFEFFYISAHKIIGISVPFRADDLVDLLEAAAVLGYVHRCYEDSEIPPGATWKSIHDSMGDTIHTAFDPTI